MHLLPGQSTSTEDSEDDPVGFPGNPPHQSVWAIQEFFFHAVKFKFDLFHTSTTRDQVGLAKHLLNSTKLSSGPFFWWGAPRAILNRQQRNSIYIYFFFSKGKGLILFMPMIYRGDAGAVAAAVCGEVIQAMPNSKPDHESKIFCHSSSNEPAPSPFPEPSSSCKYANRESSWAKMATVKQKICVAKI